MSQQNHSNLIERIRFGIDIARIALPPICLPVYLLLIFHTKESFKNLVAFKLIVSLALMDCFYLIQTFTNGIFTTFAPHLVEDSALPDSHPLRIFIKVISSTRIGHLVAVPLLNFILALNRLTVMANKKYWTIWRKGYKVFIVVAWIIYIPGMMTLQFAIPGVEFDLAVFGYTYHGPYSLKCVVGYAGPLFEVGAFCCTFGIVVIVLAKKKFFGVNFKISPLEIRLIIQSLLICVPISLVTMLGLMFARELRDMSLFYMGWHGLATMIAPINLLVYIVFNTIARRHMKANVLGKTKAAVAHCCATKSAIERLPRTA